MKQRVCAQCDAVVPDFVQVTGKWLGNPVLYMGIDPITNYALCYQFCDADCMLDWLKEVLGE